MKKIEEAIAAFSRGEFVLVTDDEGRENEGDLVIAAEKVTAKKMGFMVRHTTGIICISMPEERLEELNLPQMVSQNTGLRQTAFTVSVDAKDGITTGVSAADRAETLLKLVDEGSESNDFCRPGHIFPLRYKKGGVLKRAGHTEAAVDLALLADLKPAAVLCEVVNDDGSMARLPEIQKFAKEYSIPVISVADIVRYRRRTEKLVTCVSEAMIPSAHGNFKAHVYSSSIDGIEHMALVYGDILGKDNVLVRVHSECLTGDVFGSRRCDCGSQLDLAMERISEQGAGVIVYLRGHEGRGIGLGHKLRAYDLQDKGKDTVDANLELGLPVDSREYGIGAQILSDLGVTTLRLMTNNPAKYSGLDGYDLEVVERVPLICAVTDENRKYLRTKQQKLGHLLEA